MEKKQFEFELVDYENLNELSEMFNLCFDAHPPENYFKWKFLDNPAGRAIGFVARYKGQIAGFYGVIPEYYMAGGERTVIYQSMDTMTHPDYQRQGLFTRLAKTTYEHLIDSQGETFIIGFPGLTSHPGFVKKLGWKDIVLIDYLFLNKNVFRAKSLFKKNSNLEFQLTERLDDSFDAYFDKKTYNPNKIVKLINTESLNWQIADNPLFKSETVKISQNGETIGIVIYKMHPEGRCFIHHLDFADESFYEKHLSAVCGYLFETTVASFLFTFEPTANYLLRAYKKNWFVKNPFTKGPFSFKPPFIGYSNKEKVKGLNFFDKATYDLQPIYRDY